MKILLLVISLSFLLLSQATFAYTLTNIDTKFANNKVKILNERIKKGASYETIYKQQLLFQKNIKKNRDSKNVKSVTYKNLDKNYAISQYILDNLINYGAVNQNIVTTIPIKTQEQIVVKKQTCDDGWYYNEGAMSCQPNNPTRTCSISNGIGKQTWNGNNWESCIVASCISGYSVSNGNCSVNQSIQQQTTTTNQLTCSSDQHIENNTCISNIRSCGISNGIGKQTWNGNNWDSCIVASCNSGYSVSNGNCSVKQPMEQPNTTTTTTTTNQLTCSSDQHIENNTCISNIRDCSISNGYGSQIWSTNTWGSCNLTSCGYGFIPENNSCKYTKPYLTLFQDNIGNNFTNSTSTKNAIFIPNYTDNYKSIGTIKEGDTLNIRINTIHPINEPILCYYTFAYEQGSTLNGLQGGLSSKSLTSCNSTLDISKIIGNGRQILLRLTIKTGTLTNIDQIYNFGSGEDSFVVAYDIIP